jgi:pimeloyl-ACP methyl ester carboxylesterase
VKKLVLSSSALLLVVAANAQARDAACEARPIKSGYGSSGPYAIDARTIVNPGDRADNMTVYLPMGASGARPVVFFAHGFGPGRPETYIDFIRHMVSVGDVVVFSSYQLRDATIDQRYDALWQGFRAAVAAFGPRMDTTRVAFVGHSFGGGAVPAMAYRGLVQDGWGRNGAFLLELAPWYSYQITQAELAALASRATQIVEVYDSDVVNDHRMAIDLYDAIASPDRQYLMVHSSAECGFTADHATPGRNPSVIQKEYAVFKPFDAAADLAFNGNAGARRILSQFDSSGSDYHPVSVLASPTPDQPEAHYRMPWTSRQNPRYTTAPR